MSIIVAILYMMILTYLACHRILVQWVQYACIRHTHSFCFMIYPSHSTIMDSLSSRTYYSVIIVQSIYLASSATVALSKPFPGLKQRSSKLAPRPNVSGQSDFNVHCLLLHTGRSFSSHPASARCPSKIPDSTLTRIQHFQVGSLYDRRS
jgi:hypothetical protein